MYGRCTPLPIGREKEFHTILVHAFCDRRGEVERKRRSDARTTGVDTAIGLPGSTDITAFPESIYRTILVPFDYITPTE
jgi:hypothetical protein